MLVGADKIWPTSVGRLVPTDEVAPVHALADRGVTQRGAVGWGSTVHLGDGEPGLADVDGLPGGGCSTRCSAPRSLR